MTISLKAAPDGLSGTIQVGGVDKMSIGATGIQLGVLTTSYANDAAAAVAGVPVVGLYHTAGTVKIRLA